MFLWAGVIFYFSTETFSSENTAPFLSELISRLFPAVTQDQLEIAGWFLRKFGHWSEYFVLAVLLVRAFDTHDQRLWQVNRALWTLGLVLVYAASDEIHQLFVPGRTAAAADVLIDFLGGACGVLWMRATTKRSKARQQYRRD